MIPFESDVVSVQLNGRDSVMTNAQKLAAVGGGGTNCSAPLAWLNRKQAKGDLVVFVSDNESWVDAKGGRGTETMRQWSVFKRFNPQARLVCIDIQPNATVQAAEAGAIPSCDILAVLEEFNHPRHAEFAEPTRWSFLNAFTEVSKKYSPARADVCQRKLTRLFGLDGQPSLLWDGEIIDA